MVLARGARERQRPHAVGMQHADDLRDDAAHRRADDVRALDARGVEDGDRVGGHAHEVVRAGRRVGVAGAAVVERDATVPAAERAALQRPTAAVHAETLDQQDGRTVAPTPRAVRDLGAVVGDGGRHASNATVGKQRADRVAHRVGEAARPRADRSGRTARAA